MSSRHSLFARKPLSMLLEEMKGENRLRRVLGPVQLTGPRHRRHHRRRHLRAHRARRPTTTAGPSLMLSFVVSGIACIFAALCYAEFASMVPVAGSAYTYAYATLGELFAWIIGWDLVLEYTVGIGHRGQRLVPLLPGRSSATSGSHIPKALAQAPFDYDPDLGRVRRHRRPHQPARHRHRPDRHRHPGQGHPGERDASTRPWSSSSWPSVLFVIVVGAFYVNPANWHPFAPFGWTGISFFGHTLVGQTDAGGKPLGMLAGAAIIFFAYIGFDSVSTHAEEAKNPQRDVPIGIIASLLVCTVLYIAVVGGAHRHGPLRPDRHQRAGLRRLQAGRPDLGPVPHRPRRRRRHHLGAAGDDALAAARVPGHGPRRPAAAELLRRRAPNASARPGSPPS